MADRIQQRRDTAARWAQYNPILLEGEVGYVTDDPNQYKIGDGVHAWNELPLRGFDGTLVHELGDSQTAAMSQQGVTDLTGLMNFYTFSAEKEYEIGDIVIYLGNVYEFVFKHSSGEWDETHVKVTTLRSIIPLLSSLCDDLNLVRGYETVRGYYNKNTGKLTESEGNFVAVLEKIPISPGGKYIYRGGMFGNLGLPIYDVSDNLITSIVSNDPVSGVVDYLKVFKAPNNAAYIKISSFFNGISLPMGLFEYKTLTNEDEVRLNALSSDKDKSFLLLESGTGYYTISEEDSSLVFNEDNKYFFYKYKNIPNSLVKIYYSGVNWAPTSVIGVNSDGTAVRLSIYINKLVQLGNYSEVYFQTLNGSKFHLQESTIQNEKIRYSGGYTNLIKNSDIQNGFYSIGTDAYQIKESSSRLDFVRAKVTLKPDKLYIVSGHTGGLASSAKCFLSFTGENEYQKSFTLNGEPFLIATSIYELDLYYCSVVTQIDLGEPSVIGVYEVVEPSMYDGLFFFKTNKDNTLYGWYDVNLNFNEQQRPSNYRLTNYCHSTPISVKAGQRLRYHGAGYKLLQAVLSCSSDGTPDGILKISTGSELHNEFVDIDFTVPSGVEFIIIQFRIDVTESARLFDGYCTGSYLLDLGIDNNIADTDVQWTVPDKIYSIKGVEKSIYFDNIVNRNEDAPEYVIEVNKTFGDVDGRRFYFTENAVGNKTVVFNAWNKNNELISSKTINIEIIDSTLATVKRVVCIGDSITEGRGEGDTNTNIPYHLKKAFDTVITSGSENVVFVGSKGTPVKHEGWWGRNYQWLANVSKDPSQPSPLVNPDTDELDIHYYRTQKCGLSDSEYIDVVSLAMGFNDTATESQADSAFTSMQNIITAFKEDNPNTKFIIQLVTYPAMGNVKQPNSEQKIDKKNSLYYFRKLCMDAYNNGQDSNIFIGDFGLGYDRWYAYIRETVHPASYYEQDEMQVVTDRVHPSYRGAKQMAENMMHCVLKAMNM